MGTPGAWSTNDPTDDYYYALNTFGPHYWFIVMDMDCSQTQVYLQQVIVIAKDRTGRHGTSQKDCAARFYPVSMPRSVF
jgi:hypothetical protein